MVESSDEPSLLHRTSSCARKAHASHHPFRAACKRPAPPLASASVSSNATVSAGNSTSGVPSVEATPTTSSTSNHVAEDTSSALPPTAPPLNAEHREESAPIEPKETPNIAHRFYEACKEILLSSWLNTLLVFVPVGIAVQAAGVNKSIVFAINAIAIIPLAGLLSHATQSVASEMGDTIGALMNITFGNAVELIILWALAFCLRKTLLTSV